ncbi:MAG TPA: aldehyde dehydrogenase family protein [Gaiellaceae bacterium]|nr:aldehyde dehydrogenase family protein [Gaiellaceae bacterium]
MSGHDCTIRELVGDEIRLPAGELPAPLSDSDTGEVLHPQLASSAESVEQALATAEAVHRDGVWADLPVAERAAALRKLQAEVAARAPELGRLDSLDNGVPQSTTVTFIGAVSALLEVGAAQLEAGFGHDEQQTASGPADQWRLPWGPAAIFMPWNAPAHTAIVKSADALTAGCPVVLKPSEWAPHFSGVFAEAVRASLPPGVVQILHGGREVGAALVADPRVAAVSYTGGVAGGTAVAETCARQLKPVDLELSGNNPVVVLPGEEPAAVAANVLTALLMLNGQYCVGPRRLIVPEDEVDGYVAAFGEALDAVAIGPTDDPSTQLGPLAHEAHRERLEAQLAEFASRGCEVRRFGTLPDSGGHFLAPALVVGDGAAEIREEVFGPVLQVRGYDDLDEAVAIANDHPYGLCGYVFGSDRDAARAVGRRLRAGLVRLNSPFGPPDSLPVASFWGVSGVGAFGVGQGVQFFSGARYVG